MTDLTSKMNELVLSKKYRRKEKKEENPKVKGDAHSHPVFHSSIIPPTR